MCISNKIGPPVEGEDFFGREKEIRNANRLLERNHSLLLSAPRRIGKSSLAKRLIEEKLRQGWKCVYIDLEETTTENGFLRLIIEAFKTNGVWKHISEEMSKGLVSILDRIEKVTSTWSERLTEYREYEVPARQILKSLSTQPAGMEREAMLHILMTGQEVSKIEEVDYTLSKILEMLENDGYILRKESTRTFRSPLLRDYWFNKFVQ